MAVISLVGSLSPARAWARYNQALHADPLKTKALTCMGCFIIGDTLAQITTKKGKLHERLAKWDPARTARMAGFGLFYIGPVGHFFYTALDKAVMPATPTHPVAVFSKVAFDQLVYTPICTSMFFAWNGVLSNRGDQVVQEIKSKLWPTTVTGWTLWTPAMTINMMFVPSHLRLAYINVVSLVWTNILSQQAARQQTLEAAVLEELNSCELAREEPLRIATDMMLPSKPLALTV